MDRNVNTKAALLSPKGLDPVVSRSRVRLACLEIASHRVASAGAAYDAKGVVAVAKIFENYVFDD